MHKVASVEVEKNIMKANEAIAERNKKLLEDNNI